MWILRTACSRSGTQNLESHDWCRSILQHSEFWLNMRGNGIGATAVKWMGSLSTCGETVSSRRESEMFFVDYAGKWDSVDAMPELGRVFTIFVTALRSKPW